MKKTTCKNLKGACDMDITGSTPEEMGENCKKHVMEMIQKGDIAHMEAANAMGQISKDEFDSWFENFKNTFDTLEDA